ncbi:MAG: division/cell wall cluster transcriptional repressor MraZ [Erysipelotrichaceae bacterium]
MYMGEYAHNMDAKGRIILPAKFREQLGPKVVVTRGLDSCLTVHSMDAWEKIYQDLLKLPTTKKEARMYVHMLTAKACECELDGQGRILIPSSLSKEAKLMKECMIIGAASRIEIWDAQRWNEYYDAASMNFEEIAEAMTDFIL